MYYMPRHSDNTAFFSYRVLMFGMILTLNTDYFLNKH